MVDGPGGKRRDETLASLAHARIGELTRGIEYLVSA
jgi:hypothetical protein